MAAATTLWVAEPAMACHRLSCGLAAAAAGCCGLAVAGCGCCRLRLPAGLAAGSSCWLLLAAPNRGSWADLEAGATRLHHLLGDPSRLHHENVGAATRRSHDKAFVVPHTQEPSQSEHIAAARGADENP